MLNMFTFAETQRKERSFDLTAYNRMDKNLQNTQEGDKLEFSMGDRNQKNSNEHLGHAKNNSQYQEGTGRGQNRAGLDQAQKWPSCVGLSIRNGSLLKGGSRRGSEESPRKRPGKASTNTSKTKSERRTPSGRMMTKSV